MLRNSSLLLIWIGYYVMTSENFTACIILPLKKQGERERESMKERIDKRRVRVLKKRISHLHRNMSKVSFSIRSPSIFFYFPLLSMIIIDGSFKYTYEKN